MTNGARVRVAALVHRREFLDQVLKACQRANLWGQAGTLKQVIDDVETELRAIEKESK